MLGELVRCDCKNISWCCRVVVSWCCRFVVSRSENPSIRQPVNPSTRQPVDSSTCPFPRYPKIIDAFTPNNTDILRLQ